MSGTCEECAHWDAETPFNCCGEPTAKPAIGFCPVFEFCTQPEHSFCAGWQSKPANNNPTISPPDALPAHLPTP